MSQVVPNPVLSPVPDRTALDEFIGKYSQWMMHHYRQNPIDWKKAGGSVLYCKISKQFQIVLNLLVDKPEEPNTFAQMLELSNLLVMYADIRKHLGTPK